MRGIGPCVGEDQPWLAGSQGGGPRGSYRGSRNYNELKRWGVGLALSSSQPQSKDGISFAWSDGDIFWQFFVRGCGFKEPGRN